MMQKQVKFSVNDIAADTDGVDERLNRLCSGRHDRYMVRGLVQVEKNVVFLLLPCKADQVQQYKLVPLEDSSEDGLEAELADRWTAGFDTIGNVNLGDGTHLLLVAREK